MGLLLPAQTMYFGVLFWDMQGPLWQSAAGDRGAQLATSIVGGVVANLANIVFGGFREVTGLTLDLETEDHHEGGNDYAPLRFRKGGGSPELVFKRGVSGRTELWDWHHQVLSGTAPAIRKSGVVLLFDRNSYVRGVETDRDPPRQRIERAFLDWIRVPIGAWYFHNGLPKQIVGPTLNAGATGDAQTAIEELHILHEGLTRLSLSSIPGLADIGAAFGGIAGDLGAGLSVVGDALGR
jgi:phage tail-like protein